MLTCKRCKKEKVSEDMAVVAKGGTDGTWEVGEGKICSDCEELVYNWEIEREESRIPSEPLFSSRLSAGFRMLSECGGFGEGIASEWEYRTDRYSETARESIRLPSAKKCIEAYTKAEQEKKEKEEQAEKGSQEKAESNTSLISRDQDPKDPTRVFTLAEMQNFNSWNDVMVRLAVSKGMNSIPFSTIELKKFFLEGKSPVSIFDLITEKSGTKV
jgi:hypothetical protein